MKIYAEAIAHKDTSRIKLTFYKEDCPIDPQQLPSGLLCGVRKTGGCSISKNLKAWNFPYRETLTKK